MLKEEEHGRALLLFMLITPNLVYEFWMINKWITVILEAKCCIISVYLLLAHWVL